MNDLSARQWHIDTPGAGVLYPFNFKCAHIQYAGYSTQGNQAVITDKNGKIVCTLLGAADLEEVRSSKIGWVNGLIVPTLQGNGFVTIYTE